MIVEFYSTAETTKMSTVYVLKTLSNINWEPKTGPSHAGLMGNYLAPPGGKWEIIIAKQIQSTLKIQNLSLHILSKKQKTEFCLIYFILGLYFLHF